MQVFAAIGTGSMQICICCFLGTLIEMSVCVPEFFVFHFDNFSILHATIELITSYTIIRYLESKNSQCRD